MPDIDDSDIHSVASHDVNPARNLAVCHWLKLEPTTVRLTDPVAPAFLVWLPCNAGMAPSIDHTAVTVPEDSSPAVTASRLLPDGEALTALHLNTESDSHRVLSHAESPRRAWRLEVRDPKPDPSTVTLEDPVPALFVLSFVVFPMDAYSG